MAVLSIYVLQGVFIGGIVDYLFPVTVIAFVGMAVESIPIHDIDNITVTAAAALVGHLLL